MEIVAAKPDDAAWVKKAWSKESEQLGPPFALIQYFEGKVGRRRLVVAQPQLGFCLYRLLPRGIYINAIVAGEKRKGVGRGLLKFLAEHYTLIELTTNPDNTVARSFYEAIGFSYCGQERGKKGGMLAVYMANSRSILARLSCVE